MSVPKVERQALQPWQIVPADWLKGGVLSIGILAAGSEKFVILDLRTGFMGYLDLTITGGATESTASAVTVNVRPAYLDSDGVLQDSGATDIAVATGLDFTGAASTVKTLSITNAYSDSGDAENFMHGAGLVIGLIDASGSDQAFTLQFGWR